MFLQAPVFSASGAASIGNVDVREAEIRTGPQGQTALVYGLFDDVDIRSEQRYDELTTEFTQFTLDGSHDFGNGLTLTALVGMAESKHDNPKQTTLLFDAFDIDGYVYDYRRNDRLPLISYGNLDVDRSCLVDAVADPPAAADRGQQLRHDRGHARLRVQPGRSRSRAASSSSSTSSRPPSSGARTARPPTSKRTSRPASPRSPLADYSSLARLDRPRRAVRHHAALAGSEREASGRPAQPVRPEHLPDGHRALARQQPGGQRGRHRCVPAARLQRRPGGPAGARQRRVPATCRRTWRPPVTATSRARR